jgi:hypothetical protein
MEIADCVDVGENSLEFTWCWETVFLSRGFRREARVLLAVWELTMFEVIEI